LHNYFVRHALAEDEIDRVAAAAFRLYGGATRTFSLATLTEMIGAETTAKLTNSHTLVVNGDLAYFDHHLKHDYLVSKFISADPQRWAADNFNVITFNASSFDTVVLAMEQMPDQGRADGFFRALYDWNIYGAGYALSEHRYEMVSPDMTVVVHAMFAERRWEIFVHTAKTAEDILSLIGTELSARLLTAGTPTEILEIVREQPGQAGWFATWRDLFTAHPDTNATEEDLLHLRNPVDSVMGWTSSNVLRRKNVSPDQQESIRQTLLQGQAAVVRWRAAHVLGHFPSKQNADALLQSLTHDTREVRYGATRSLVEMAARSQLALAEEILGSLAELAPQLAEFTNVVGEFQKTLVIRKDVAPAGWTKIVLPAVAAFQRATINYKTREDWDRTIQKDIQALAEAAWKVRENAHVIGATKVGCALVGCNGQIYVGCNVEHRFRSHDVHAEVNAITSMVSHGCQSFRLMFIAAQRERFTPCGACMDWVMQFATDSDVPVIAQAEIGGELLILKASQLMPYYPR
jgi:cytidine deaminase